MRRSATPRAMTAWCSARATAAAAGRACSTADAPMRSVLDHMKRRVAAPDASDTDRKLLEEAQRNADAGPDKPFLDLCFTNAEEGFVVGAYGLIMRTADGGRNWESWFDRVDNAGLLNLYAICAASAARIYIAGEGGLLLKLERRREALPAHCASPYKGSFFGLAATERRRAGLRHARQCLPERTTQGASLDAGRHRAVRQHRRQTPCRGGRHRWRWSTRAAALRSARDGGRSFDARPVALAGAAGGGRLRRRSLARRGRPARPAHDRSDTKDK